MRTPGVASRVAALGVATIGIATFAACGSITDGGARQTMPPLPPPQENVALAPAAPAAAPVTTAAPAGPGDTGAADDDNAASVATRFLAAVDSGNIAAGRDLAHDGRQPDVVDWAMATHLETLEVAGDDAWGSPECSEAGSDAVTCTWLRNAPTTMLVLTRDGDAWRVSHPLAAPQDDPQPAGSRCVIGSQDVNVRGGPATSYPRFTQLAPGQCDITAFDATATDSEGEWRYIEVGGQRGWVVDRVLRE